MRLPARLMIAALALAVGGSIGGCSAGAGLAYAGDSSRPQAGVVAAGSAAAAAASAHATAAPTAPAAPAGPRIVVTGAPRGVKAKAGILADATTGQVLWSSGGNTERPIAEHHQGDDRPDRPRGGQPEQEDHGPQVRDRLRHQVRREQRRAGARPGADRRRAAARHAARVGLRRRVHAGHRLRPGTARVHREDERDRGPARPHPHALHVARRPALPDRDLHVLHARPSC